MNANPTNPTLGNSASIKSHAHPLQIKSCSQSLKASKRHPTHNTYKPPRTVTSNTSAKRHQTTTRTTERRTRRAILQPIDNNSALQNPRQRNQPTTKPRPHPSTNPRTSPRISLTDLKTTNELWLDLRTQNMSRYLRETEASRNRGKAGPSSTASQTVSSRSSRSTNETKRPKMKDAGFRQTVLLPREISFPSSRELSDPFAHFETTPPDTAKGYKGLDGGGHTAVWLEADDVLVKDIIREYQYMRNEGLCEAEFSSYAKETLLRRDPRFPSHEEAREWRTERMIELVAKPTTSPNSHWCPPPLAVEAAALEYNFDVRPDCQYWLSTRIFNPVYSRLFSRWVYVHNDRITCPYFTIEFKKDGSSLELAQNQVAAAAATALYNRSLLKVARLKLTKKKWTAKHTSTLRHYGLTLHGANYTFWCIRLKGTTSNPEQSISPHEWTWPGCEMVEASPGNLFTAPNVEHFFNWVNEIHRWGLMVHGPSCQKDVQFGIDTEELNVRTSLRANEGIDPDSDTEMDSSPPQLLL